MFLLNHYQKPSHLTVSDGTTQECLLSEEGCTQGDPAAMTFYALGVKPLIDQLYDGTNKDLCMQSWYADDSSAIGKLKEIRNWWQKLSTLGLKYGYYPKACKTHLVLKDPSLMNRAKSLFANTGIKITIQGQRHLGAVIGTDANRCKYVQSKVNKWIKDITELADIAREEPQAALSAYTKSICHRWTFIQRTIPNTTDLFIPLEDSIRNVFIPSIIGRAVSDIERKILSLPVRFGGLGIANPSENTEREYEASQMVTKYLSELILKQEQDFSLYNQDSVNKTVQDLKKAKEDFLSTKFQNILTTLGENESLKRCLKLNREKGIGSWLTVLPLKDQGYCLNKQEFKDAICLRYGWKVPNMPQYCGCGALNGINHALICAKGGYVSIRHDALRDLNVDL